MDTDFDQYEMYMLRGDWETLNAHTELSLPLRLALRIAVFDFEKTDYCRIYPDIPAVVEISRVLGRIPRHYHTRLADALRADGWSKHGRPTPHQQATGDEKPAPLKHGS